MQGMNGSANTVFAPHWMRIGVASLMFALTVLLMWKHFQRFDWIPWPCMGLYYLTYVPRQKGEAFWPYFAKPRSFLTMVLLFTALAGFGRNLYVLYAK
jgi:hypothetical protein